MLCKFWGSSMANCQPAPGREFRLPDVVPTKVQGRPVLAPPAPPDAVEGQDVAAESAAPSAAMVCWLLKVHECDVHADPAPRKNLKWEEPIESFLYMKRNGIFPAKMENMKILYLHGKSTEVALNFQMQWLSPGYS